MDPLPVMATFSGFEVCQRVLSQAMGPFSVRDTQQRLSSVGLRAAHSAYAVVLIDVQD